MRIFSSSFRSASSSPIPDASDAPPASRLGRGCDPGHSLKNAGGGRPHVLLRKPAQLLGLLRRQAGKLVHRPHARGLLTPSQALQALRARRLDDDEAAIAEAQREGLISDIGIVRLRRVNDLLAEVSRDLPMLSQHSPLRLQLNELSDACRRLADRPKLDPLNPFEDIIGMQFRVKALVRAHERLKTAEQRIRVAIAVIPELPLGHSSRATIRDSAQALVDHGQAVMNKCHALLKAGDVEPLNARLETLDNGLHEVNQLLMRRCRLPFGAPLAVPEDWTP